MFKITIRNRYGYKDQEKANIANAYIGYGRIGSSTEEYFINAQDQNIPCNTEIEPNNETVAFVSINGGSKVLNPNHGMTLMDVSRVLQNGGTVITDNPYHRERSYNTGERWLAGELKKLGYKENPLEHYSLWVKE
ncbi:hypothetical protein ACFGWE_03725 [Pasteurella multocida]